VPRYAARFKGHVMVVAIVAASLSGTQLSCGEGSACAGSDHCAHDDEEHDGRHPEDNGGGGYPPTWGSREDARGRPLKPRCG
jgi:hypothetical protein